MPIKGEQQGYTYKALIDGEWQEVTIQESPLELVERFEQDEEWTRVRHGHWIGDVCSECGKDALCDCDKYEIYGTIHSDYCPHCGAKMDEDEVGE